MNMTTAYVEQEKESFVNKDIIAKEAELLAKWGVPTNDFFTLSGGEKLKVRLAKGFAENPNVLILDEPTNHLDEMSTEFLIKQIKNMKGTVIVVSHDRYFLDVVATRIWSIEDKKLIDHSGNYTSYMKAREHKRMTRQREYEKQQKEDRTSRNSYKRIKLMVTKGTCAVHKTRRCERVLSCKGGANGCASKIETKTS
ncbi:ATP-binding cassette domain-containing protein [Bacillus pacificus]